MPPHCDAIDGPVVKAAIRALDAGDVNLILPYVHKDGEPEVIAVFEKVLPLHAGGNAARAVADLYFFETVVRVHRAGEGAPFTGLKPAGLDVGPVIPVAEAAIEDESVDRLADLLARTVQDEVRERFRHVMHLKQRAAQSLESSREYVSAMLGLQVWSHGLYLAAKSAAHGAGDEHK